MMHEGGIRAEEIDVRPVAWSTARPWIMRRHYARRTCPASFCFGAYAGGDLRGVVTYGVPCSATLRSGLCGPEWAGFVLELNRLSCEGVPNLPSLLVSRSLRLLPAPRVVVSYADTEQGHVGYVYQAANFLYTGLSAIRTNWKIRGEEHLHGQTVADRTRGEKNRAATMRKEYGDAFYLEQRPRKHRYVYLHGDRRQKAAMRAALRYPVVPYPKGETVRSSPEGEIDTQRVLW